MTDKEFRRLSRADLIEIIYELQRSEKNLQDEIAGLKQKLEDRRVAIERSGSLAEVLAKLNGLFEAAQDTADDYRREAEQLLEEARSIRKQADVYQTDVRRQSEEMLAKTEEECRRLRAAAQNGQRAPQRDGENPDMGATSFPIEEDQYNGDSEI